MTFPSEYRDKLSGPMPELTPAAPGFGNALRDCRKPRNLSQVKLAEKAGFDHSYISRLESGSRTPTPEAVDAIIAALGIPNHSPEADGLRLAAGFAPKRPGAILSDPLLVRINAALIRKGETVYVAQARQALAFVAKSLELSD